MIKQVFDSGFWIAFIVMLFSCGPTEHPSLGDQQVDVFINEKVNFDPDSWQSPIDTNENDVFRLVSGRLLLKKVSLPVYQRPTAVTAKIRLESAGDRWDKSGSCFVIPKSSIINFISLANEAHEWPASNSGTSKNGVAIDSLYQPVIELMRFMTPFGVGAYSDSMSTRKPVYIPHWEQEVSWEQDVSVYISELQGEVWLGVWIDSWTKEGYKVSLNLEFDESENGYAKIKPLNTLSLVNTVSYFSRQDLFDQFALQDLSVSFNLPSDISNPKLLLTVTGHGGHSGGDEFTKQENLIYLDNKLVHRFIPWRDDCASFRRFNPSSGVWLIKDTARYLDWEARQYREKVIEERLASSDLSRSNWCPGSMVSPLEIPVSSLTAGDHQIRISVPGAQPAAENEYNHWLVSTVLVW